ncbi:MAG TPA: hypothetical protein VGI81_21430 [Tepidisphaeraceae bacterium]|jgi:hypothetical protein
MPEMIQTLEDRVLFSSTSAAIAAGSQLATDVGTARADVTQYATTLGTDVRTLAADLRALPAAGGNTKLQTTLRNDRLKWTTTVRQDVTTAVRSATANGDKTVADALRAFFHPTNATFARVLAADLKAIGRALAGPIAKLQNDVAAGRSALLTDVNTIAAANPGATTLQTDAGQVSTDSQNAMDKLSADGQAIQSDLQSMVTALGG